jgi:hypothetical protein
MIRNRNEALEHLDDLMLLRWENEGGCLGPSTMSDRLSHHEDYFGLTSEAELNSRQRAIHRPASADPVRRTRPSVLSCEPTISPPALRRHLVALRTSEMSANGRAQHDHNR